MQDDPPHGVCRPHPSQKTAPCPRPPEPTRDKIGRTVTRATRAIIGVAILAALAALGLLVAALIVGRP